MAFKRKREEAHAGEAEKGAPDGAVTPSGPTPPNGADATLFDEFGMHQLWYLERRMNDELARAARVDSVFSLACWRLKMLPGESMNAELVRKAAELIAGRLRSYDIYARIDEELFAAILFDAEAAAVSTIAFRIKADLQVIRLSTGRWQSGVSTFPDDGVHGDELIQVAFRRLEEDAKAA